MIRSIQFLLPLRRLPTVHILDLIRNGGCKNRLRSSINKERKRRSTGSTAGNQRRECRPQCPTVLSTVVQLRPWLVETTLDPTFLLDQRRWQRSTGCNHTLVPTIQTCRGGMLRLTLRALSTVAATTGFGLTRFAVSTRFDQATPSFLGGQRSWNRRG